MTITSKEFHALIEERSKLVTRLVINIISQAKGFDRKSQGSVYFDSIRNAFLHYSILLQQMLFNIQLQSFKGIDMKITIICC